MKKIILMMLLFSAMLHANVTMSQKSYNLLMEAQKNIEEDKIKEAKILLNTLLEEKNSYVQSYAYQYLANISLHNGDYKSSKKYYETIIKLDALDKERIDEIKFSLSRIYLSLEQYSQSLKLSHELLKNSKIDKKDIYEIFVFAYYYTQNFKKSIFYSQKFISVSKEKKENIYQILYASYIELKDHKNAIKTLKVMTRKWYTQKNYWLQLASLYQENKKYKKALSTIELSYKKNVLDPKKHTLFFVNLLFQNELYQKASSTLELAFKENFLKENKETFELLISSYLNAKEYDKAIIKLSHSKLAKKKKYTKILANLYYNKHDYKSTITTLTKKMKQKIKRSDTELHILLALSYFEINKKQNSITHLREIFHSKKKKRAITLAKALRINIDDLK